MNKKDQMVVVPKVRVVIGAQWGDEGKGKLVDILSEGALCCARYNGGANAGHTIMTNGSKIVAHQVPCGCIHEGTKNLIGNGVVLHLQTLDSEIKALEDLGIHALDRIFISTRCHIVLDLHRHVDSMNEAYRTSGKIGTTGRGIGPAYSSKTNRIGLRMCDFLEDGLWQKKYLDLYNFYVRQFPELKDFDPHAEIKTLNSLIPTYKDKCIDINRLISETLAVPLDESKDDVCHLLVEGANATMLDIDFGTYPYVTSSNTTIGGVSTGLGLPPRLISEVIGVVKAYTTRVGEGPFLTELSGDPIGDTLQKQGAEFGATTGRKRRCGWLDIPMLRYSHALNGFDKLMLTKLDVLSGLAEVKICVDYKLPNGELLYHGSYPASVEELNKSVPVYETLPGWEEVFDGFNSVDQFPQNAKNYINRIEELLHVPLTWIGIGPDRKDVLIRN